MTTETVQHTPGPWQVGKAVMGDITITNESGSLTVGEAHSHERVSADWSYKTTAANARLIAAAPDLLAALEAAVEFLDWAVGTEAAGEHIEAGRAAIAKARA